MDMKITVGGDFANSHTVERSVSVVQAKSAAPIFVFEFVL
jgi:hypothetical protein